MRLIDADALLNTLGIGEGGDCDKCNYNSCDLFCKRGKDFVDCCKAICAAPTIDETPLKVAYGDLALENARLKGEVKALAYAVQVNGVSGNEVPYETD